MGSLSEYEKYKLEWMIAHGISVHDICQLVDAWQKNPDSNMQDFEKYLEETGFGEAGIWSQNDFTETKCGGKKNTTLFYLYRDAANYKTYNEAVLEGCMTDEDYAKICQCCECGSEFIPSKVGLDLIRDFDYDKDLDHPWCEILGYELTNESHCGTTVQELVRRFEAAKGKWDALSL